ncbi:hypothetical protein T03_6083 [Trichinella britovi]|uniref:Uncharacterized protein n=1 Tax=Trichinella britovi TaxID=45882 RepID=A0A0V1AQQ0_TRIBR|nr:hypothetical protein T03_6083 [Trichinella britovi]
MSNLHGSLANANCIFISGTPVELESENILKEPYFSYHC